MAAEPATEAAETPTTGGTLFLNVLWWMNPVAVTCGLAIPIVVFSTFIPDDIYQLWSIRRHWGGSDLGIALLCIGALLLGGLLASRSRGSSHKPLTLSAAQQAALPKVMNVVLALMLASYVFWIMSARSEGASLALLRNALSFQEGAIGALKDRSAPVAGLTTFTQLGPIYVVLWVVARRLGLVRLWPLILVIALAAMRAFFYGERLARMEVLVPLVLSLVLFSRTKRKAPRLRSSLAPLMALPVVWFVFAVFEYSRSWLYYRNFVSLSYPEFVSVRLLGYYVTTNNNSALYYDSVTTQPHIPFYPFAGFWDFPGRSLIFDSPTFGGYAPRDWWGRILRTNNNEKNNNENTNLVSAADLSLAGALLYWLTLGLGLGIAFRLMTQGKMLGILVYGVSMIGLLEQTRMIYWVLGRYLPALAAALIIGIAFDRMRNEARRQT